MIINSICKVYFSPCGSTGRVISTMADRIAKILNVPVELHDFTLPRNRKEKYEYKPDQLVIFGTPTYAGRIPNKILPVIQDAFKGGGALAVPVVTFGNRGYDNSLIELRNELEKNGFHTVAGGAFATQHVFTEKLGEGRPDFDDMEMIVDFAVKIAEKIKALDFIPAPIRIPAKDQDKDDFEALSVEQPVGPYYKPLKSDGTPAVFLKAKPVTDVSKCARCGFCARVCPMEAIDRRDITQTPGTCIKCMACVKKCPDKAKYFDDEDMLSHIAMLEKNFSGRADSMIYR